MTAIVGVLNSQGIAIAADSAVTVTGNNQKKVYNRSNKIFTLSKYHPVGIAIYNNADFMGIPLETIIKMYRRQLDDRAFDTIEEYKRDFIEFLRSQLSQIGDSYKKNAFLGFCSEGHWAIINNTIRSLDLRKAELDALDNDDEKGAIRNEVFNAELQKYSDMLAGSPHANYITKTLDEYTQFYSNELTTIENFIQEQIAKEYAGFTIDEAHRDSIKRILYALINVEFIFERHCGLIFFGFGEKEVYPSSHLVLLGMTICDMLRVAPIEPVTIKPGERNSNIIPYAQGDVTTTVLTGVDPNYKMEVQVTVKKAFDGVSNQIAAVLNNPETSQQVADAINAIYNKLIDELDSYQFEKITGPLLEILAHMGKEDMSELAESLVNITSLKRKFTSSNSADESVGGPVDVAIITKGDGFIWMKRKHYFDIDNNPSFKDKYFKS